MCVALFLALATCTLFAAEKRSRTPRPFPNPFFAMCTGTKDAQHPTVASQVAMLRELEYDGIDHMGTRNVAETVREADAAGLRMFGIYVGGIDIDPDDPLPGGLRDAVSRLEGTGAVVWIPLQSRKFRLSSPAGDAHAVEKVRAIADQAAASGVSVALYPHANLWLERVEDAVRVARKTARPNVGVTFNLCHWLKVSEDQDLLSILTQATPYLAMVTINGADTGGWSWGWSSLIQTLDRGSYDTYRVLAVLRELGYTGPIGLQGYGIGGDVEDNLRRSKQAWDKMTARLTRDSASYATVEAWLPQVMTDEMTGAIAQFNEGDSRVVISTLARRLREAPAHLRPALEKRLIALLEGKCTADGKAQVCRLLRDWGSEACVPTLAELIRDPTAGTVALDALQAKPGRQATEYLLCTLDRAAPATAIAIMSALGERRDDAAVAPLYAIAGTASGQLADAALAALARIGSRPASDALIRLSESKTKSDACAHALLECAERFRRDGALADAARLYGRLLSESGEPAIRIAAMRGLALSEPEKGVKIVIDALKGEDAALRQAAAAMAASMEGAQVTRAFCDALPALKPYDKITVLHALSKRGDRLAVPAIVAEARGGRETVRPVALRTLGVLGDESHLALLVEAATDADESVAAAADQALATLRGPVIDGAMMSSVLTAPPAEQCVLIRSLTERNMPEAVPLFFHLANHEDPEIRREALRAMGQLADGHYLAAVLTLLAGNGDEAERGRIARAAKSIAGRAQNANERTSALLGAWHTASDAVRPDILHLLGQFGGTPALEAVSEALGSDNGEIRKAAVRALAAWPDASAAELLADIAEDAEDAAERILALRGYIVVIGKPGTHSPAETLALYEKALAMAERSEEKRRILSGIATVPDLGTLDVIAACWADEDLTTEAQTAFLQAAKLVGGMQQDATRDRLRAAAREIGDAKFGAAVEAVIDALTVGVGQITSWMMSGPYAASKDSLFDKVFPPEEGTGSNIAWRAISAMDGPFTQHIKTGDVNLIAHSGGSSNCVAYLRTGLYVPESRIVSLEMGSDDGIKAWLNGKLVHAKDIRSALKRGRDKATVHLDEGWNRLLLKVTQIGGEWGATARVVTPAGEQVPGLLFRAE